MHDLTLSTEFTVDPGRPRGGILYNDNVRRGATETLFAFSRRAGIAGPFALIEGRGPVRPAGGWPAAQWRYRRKALRHLLRRGLYRGLARLPNALRSARFDLEAALQAAAPTVEELLGWIASSECFVTGRFHGICPALLTRTPFLTLPSNSHKTEGMLAALGMEGRLMPDADAIARRLAAGCAYDEGEKARLEAYLEDARRSARAMFADIAALASRKAP